MDAEIETEPVEVEPRLPWVAALAAVAVATVATATRAAFRRLRRAITDNSCLLHPEWMFICNGIQRTGLTDRQCRWFAEEIWRLTTHRRVKALGSSLVHLPVGSLPLVWRNEEEKRLARLFAPGLADDCMGGPGAGDSRSHAAGFDWQRLVRRIISRMR
jgi:hypothetical protein